MQQNISEEQKAHDLAIAYATALCTAQGVGEPSTFYQSYNESYLEFIELVRKQN